MIVERRPPPPQPYVFTDRVMSVHPDVLDLLRQTADSYRPADAEWCALLFGSRAPSGERVEMVIIPSQHNHWGHYEVDSAAMTAAAQAAGDRLLVAQVHAHPGRDVEHSRIDDAKAASIKVLSIVVPHYGLRLPTIDGIGIHEHQNGYWHLLDTGDAMQRLVIDSTAPRATHKDLR